MSQGKRLKTRKQLRKEQRKQKKQRKQEHYLSKSKKQVGPLTGRFVRNPDTLKATEETDNKIDLEQKHDENIKDVSHSFLPLRILSTMFNFCFL